MLDDEHKLLGRWSAKTVIKAGLVVMLVGAGPLLLYTLLGPSNGNPIGLGLLMVVLVPIGFLLLGTGLLWLLIGRMQK
jgi:hypothetical protein